MAEEPFDLPGLPPFHRGDRVAGYEIKARIAAGQSDVYRAKSLGERRTVALKIVPLREMRRVPLPELTNGIAHVVTTLAIGTDDEWRVGYIAMQFVAGPSLANWIERAHAAGRRPTAAERRALVRLVQQVAAGLACLHRRGVVHGDVKPHNVVVEPGDGAADLDGSAMLVDLGTVRPHGAPAAHSTLMLAPAYAAPEQILGHRLDARTDLFALGVTLHDALLARPASERPVRPTQGLERLDAVDPAIDPDLVAIVAECTALAPEHRYPNAEALLADLARWSAGRRADVRPLAPWRRLARMIPRQPRRAAACIAAAAAATMLLMLIATAVVQARARDDLAVARDRALQRGDLAAAAAVVSADDPSWLDRCESREVGLAAVLRLARDNAATALRHAARLVSRDGLARHPILDAWFARQLAADDPSLVLHTCRLVARALYDRPQRRGGPPPAIRDALLRVVGRDTGRAALFAISAAGGLADLAVGDALLAAADDRLRRHESPREFQQLCVEALHRLAFAHLGGAVSLADLQTAERQFAETAALLARSDDPASWRDLVGPSLEDWFVTLRACRDRLGLPAPDPSPLFDLVGETVHCTAVGRSRQLLQDLKAARWPAAIADDPHRIGVIAAYCCTAGPDLQAVRSEFVQDPRRGSAAGVAEFDQGVAFVAARLDPAYAPWFADPGSQLAEELLPADAPGELAIERTRVAAPTLAAFDFGNGTARCGGCAIAIRTTRAHLVLDESRPPQWFLWLGCPGSSAVDLEFVETADAAGDLAVRIHEQRGRRAALPDGGEAGVDLLLDGVVQASWRDAGGFGERVITLANPTIEPGRRRVLTLRLSADANTTLRLFQVVVE